MIHEVITITVEGSNTGEYQPKLYTYILDNSPDIDSNRRRPAVLICPGGGYSRTSDREAEPVAIQMNAMGFHAFVLRYSCAPAVFPAAQLEAAKAIWLIREHAAEWNVDADKVVIMGFSAGGHLAASVGTLWNRDFLYDSLQVTAGEIRPDAMILCYPVITSGKYAHQRSFSNLLGEREGEEELRHLVSLEHQVNSETPPAFIWHTFEDESVMLENTLLFASAMREAKVPVEVHIYPKGRHGLSLANKETSPAEGAPAIVEECQNWISMAKSFIYRLK